ncbi:GNAT family N-acetyltransferase [Desulfosarcina sp. OttesenSCG-928-G10]|nr:GNAT family N-acetyltransferase [Desulfosarcina sp. OttesenSCG-928-G10]
MKTAPFTLALLNATHDRSVFCCGSPPLDRYFREMVVQDVRRRVAACFVALTEAHRIAGYYTLSSASVPLSGLPAVTARKLPRYPSIPAVRLGRLAVDQTFNGQGLGGALLADAVERTMRAEIASFALIVDAKDESAAGFYLHHGFMALPDSPLMLFRPLGKKQFGRDEGI